MSEQPSVWRSFPRTFWIANTIEIFERMGWYGFYTVSTLYLTGSVMEGGLGFSSQDRGIIQGLVSFFLYLFPAVFGALADKYGYKKMFVASFVVMSPAYIFLSIPHAFWPFFFVYLFVALGHGMFKPVVVGTVAKVTDERTGTLGFGIFYMMVNIGGFLGPVVAGVVRGWDWKYVFYCSSGWLALNLVLCLLFYDEPPHAEGATKKTLKKTMEGMVEVVGNARFFLLIAGLMLALVMGSKWWEFSSVALVAAGWLAGNFAYDALLRGLKPDPERFWLFKPMKIGDKKYLLFLFLMSGFWTAYNQVALTLPEYIRDYTDTGDLIRAFTPAALWIRDIFTAMGLDTSEWHKGVLINGQVKPEHLINLNAFGIIALQIFISLLMRKVKAFTTIVSGTLVTGLSFALFLWGSSGWIVVWGILVFSVGEMMASPKAQEYVGRIAPPEKVGMFMGYYFWCVALGNLFGGLLSGAAYQHFGPKGVNQPNTMWLFFVGLSLVSAFLMWVYDRWATRNLRTRTNS